MQEINKKKFCKKCNDYLDIDKFYEGLRRRICIVCIKKTNREKWLKVRDKVLAASRAKRLKDKEEREGLGFYNSVYVDAIPINEQTWVVEIEYCSYFGCKNKLKLTEKLCGNKCITHMGIKEPNFDYGKL